MSDTIIADKPVETIPEHQDDVSAEPEAEVHSGPVTVFVDPLASELIKHPLEHGWVLWYDSVTKKQSAENWGDNQKVVYTFRFIEDFWGIYNTIIKPSQLQLGSNFHLFKEGIKPAWEDPANAKGGKWLLQVPFVKKEELDHAWLNMALSLIGEQFADIDGNEICGSVCSPRRSMHRIAMWTKSGTDRALQEALGRRMKSLLGLSTQTVSFLQHSSGSNSFNGPSTEWRV